jgi:TolB-like protein/DNA-binding winged helix-turn-helix (wHTH) protein/Flp pilus assembly protein TadD
MNGPGINDAAHSGVRQGAAADGPWLVGDLVIDPGRRTVRRGSDEIPVPGLSFDMLLALIEAAPSLASNEQLMRRVWKSVVVSPETVSQRIKLLRDALGDDPHDACYILGVRGRGYRLLVTPVPIARHAPDGNVPLAPTRAAAVVDTTPINASQPRRRWSWLVIAAIILAAGGVLRWHSDRATGGSGEPVFTPATSTPTVAVLPFAVQSGSKSSGEIAAALADAILHRLGTIEGLSVIARYSSFAVADGNLPSNEIGRRLGANFLLGGSVLAEGDTLRVHAQLLESGSGRQLWSMRFERKAADALRLEDEIAEKVAESVAMTAGVAPSARFAGKGTRNGAAELDFLQGRALLDGARVADLTQALDRFQQAVNLDPRYAVAHASAAEAILALAAARDDQRPRPGEPSIQEARRHVEAALELDPDIGEGFLARARLNDLAGDLDAARADFERGLELAPNDARGHRSYAQFIFYSLDPFESGREGQGRAETSGRYERALQLADTARRLDPLSPWNHYVRAVMEQHLGRVDAADRRMEETLQVDPNFAPALARRGQYRWFGGDLADAIRFAENALSIDPGADWIRRLLAQFYVDIGEPGAARAVLVDAEPRIEDGLLGVLLYERRWEQAGRLALADPARQPRTWDRDYAAFALRELARRDPGTRDEVLQRLQSRIGTKQTGARSVIHHGSRFAALEAADLLADMQRTAEARRLVKGVLDSIDVDRAAATDPDIVVPLRADARQRALGLALSGRAQDALEELEGLVSDRQFRHLWYDLERQPALEDVQRRPGFASIRDEYHRQIAAQRALLAQLRERGAVPRR